MMIEPPHRSSLWRYDKTVPVNTKDDMLNCGGYEVQWEQNGGMCGVCGQPFDGLIVNGAEYKTVRSYKQGAYVNVTVEVKSNLLGFFEFRLCPRNSSKETLTHDCFERNMLWIEESWSTRYYVGSLGGIYDLHVRLPADISCTNCVIQWKFSTGYRMGGINECQCMGCGRQETFYNCADIEIRSDTFFSDSAFVSTETNIHKPLFLISDKNLTDSSIERFRQTLPVFDSPNALEIRKGESSKLKPSYNDKLQQTKDISKNVLKDAVSNIKDKHDHVKWIKPSWQTGSPHIKFKANMTFPLKITPSKKNIEKKRSFWEKNLGEASPLTTWNTASGSLKQMSFWEKISAKATPKLLIKPKPGSLLLTRFVPKQTDIYFFPANSGDSITYPLFSPTRQRATTKNGDCYSTSPNYRCKAKGQYSSTRGMDQWCLNNCKSNHCVKTMCECGCDDVIVREKKCHAVGAFEDIYGMDEWCSRICSQKSCPPNVCSVKDCQNGS
ncbi:unnamed protein product [Mytilus coruscus]|uniref:Chitin-binding type-4 domain-containing protein n=1 Tax=Mytilus coruscus TaxID=42192 RepID=A0A6J8C5G0_MYTCO|nr:unnamed protein product [Mytilus coruscus]